MFPLNCLVKRKTTASCYSCYKVQTTVAKLKQLVICGNSLHWSTVVSLTEKHKSVI